MNSQLTPPPSRPLEQLELGARFRAALPKLLISLVIAGGFIWILRHGGLPLVPPQEAFAKMAWWAIPAFAVLHALGAFLRTYRWVYLLRPIAPELSGRRVLGIGFIGYTAIVFAPLRMGEVARPWLLSQDGDVSFLQATGTVAAERILDGLILTLIVVTSLTLSTPLSPLPDHVGNLPLPVAAVPAAAYTAFATFGAAFIAMGMFYFWRERARQLVHSIVGIVSPKLATWAAQKMEKLVDGLKFIPSLSHGGAFGRDTLAYWAVTVTSFWVLLRGCGADVSFAEACVVLGITGLGTLIPSGPGFFGSYQMSAYCALAMYCPESMVVTSGAAFVFISFVVQLALTAASCVVGFRLVASTPPAKSSRAGEVLS